MELDKDLVMQGSKSKVHPTKASALTLLFIVLLRASAAMSAGAGGVKLDGTIGGPAQVLAGPTYNVTQNLGRLSGGNLFYSFQYFSVGTSETALFTTNSPGINNVISRVTGGYASTIDGTISLQSAYGAPNFFLINPNGVTFTSNAVVNVPAAFNVTTANYLKFSDGNFYAGPSRGSTLSAAAPEAFGFFGKTRAPVNIQGAVLSGGVGGTGEFQIVAGDVIIDGEGGQGGITNVTGDVRVTAVGAQATEVPLTGNYNSNDGSVMIQNGGAISTYGAFGTGAIEVNTGSLTMDGMTVPGQTGIFSTAGDNDSGPIVVNASGTVSLINGASIGSTATGAGTGGNILLSAANLNIDAQGNPSSITGIASIASGNGNGGGITLQLGSLVMHGGTSYNSNAAIYSSATGYSSMTDAPTTGSAGNIVIHATGSVTMLSGGEIISGNGSGFGNVGNISISAQSLTIEDSLSSVLYSGIFSGSSFTDFDSSTNGGNITLKLGSLLISGYGAAVSSENTPEPLRNYLGTNAGSIVISVTGSALIENHGSIYASSFGTPGNISLSAESLAIDSQGSIDTDGLGTANAGQIQLKSGSLTIDGGVVSSKTNSFNCGYGPLCVGYSQGLPGRIIINTGMLTLESNGSIDISDNTSIETYTLTTPYAVSSAQVDITAQQIYINGGQITAASTGSDPAGAINVNYTSDLRMDLGTIATSSVGANGGPITIVGRGPLRMDNSNITTSVLGMSNGNGGDIQISVPTIVLNTAAIQANTAAPQALGGTVNINAVVIPSFDFVLLGGSLQQFDPTLLGLNLIQAAAPDGVSGTLNLTNPALDIGSSLLGLTGAPATRAVLGRSLCDFRHGSSLLTAGRGGLPTSARDPMWIDAEDFIRQPTTSENAPATDNHYLALSPIANSSIFGCR